MIYIVHALPPAITIGKQTETGVQTIGFECREWLAKWPGMIFGAWVTPPGGAEAYPADCHLEGSVLYWEVNAADTAVAGVGQAEIVGIAEGKKKLSATVAVKILPSATAVQGEVPDHAKPWVDAVLEAAARAEEAAKRAEAAEGGGIAFEVDETLTLENGILSVNTTDTATEEDPRPITSQGVYNEFAVIHALLKTI